MYLDFSTRRWLLLTLPPALIAVAAYRYVANDAAFAAAVAGTTIFLLLAVFVVVAMRLDD